MNLFTKQKQTHRLRERIYGEGRIVTEFGINIYTLLYLKWITNKDLLYTTGNYAQYYVTTDSYRRPFPRLSATRLTSFLLFKSMVITGNPKFRENTAV